MIIQQQMLFVLMRWTILQTTLEFFVLDVGSTPIAIAVSTWRMKDHSNCFDFLKNIHNSEYWITSANNSLTFLIMLEQKMVQVTTIWNAVTGLRIDGLLPGYVVKVKTCLFYNIVFLRVGNNKYHYPLSTLTTLCQKFCSTEDFIWPSNQLYSNHL